MALSVAIAVLGLTGLGLGAPYSFKRGLIHIPSANHPEDDAIWTRPGSDLTWYYNYGSRPSPAFNNVPQDKFEFIPMMWGINKNNPTENNWLHEVLDLIDRQKRDIRHVLAFNEPDGPAMWGGSDIPPALAAKAWIANFEPLAERGVKLGLPAVTGAPAGLVWLQDFLAECKKLRGKECTFDFIPVHWYDNFGGLTSHINERRSLWPDKEIWPTEYAYAHRELYDTQLHYNQSSDLFDKSSYIGKYSYFGAFRSDVSNVGPNAVFLNSQGLLTDIGSWYLGAGATGVRP